MDAIISSALSADNVVRRRAEAALSYARTQRGYSVALAKRLALNANAGGDGDPASEQDEMWMPKRLMAGMLLQHFVRDRWEVADQDVLPREDKTQVRSIVLATMVDFSAPRSVRASASRVVALMAAGGEGPADWVELIPSLIGQLALAAVAVMNARTGGGGRSAAAGLGLGREASCAGEGGGAGGAGVDEATRAAAAAAAAAEHAVARAESCAQCLQYLTEEVPMEHVPELFQQAFPGLLQAGKADSLPRSIQRTVFRIVRELFISIGTLVSIRGETRLLPGLKQCVPPWLHLVSKKLQSAADGRTGGNVNADGSDSRADGVGETTDGFPGGGGGRRTGGSEGEGGREDFGVELEGLRTAMTLLAHVPSTVGDGHLGQLLPPLWELLTNGRERHEQIMLSVGGGAGGGDDDGQGEGGYASDGERQGFEELIVHSLELLAATAACPDPQVSGLLGGEGAGVGSLLAVVIRYLQLPSESCALWRDSPNEFVVAELEEGEGAEMDGAGGGAVGATGAGAGGRPPVSTARSAGLALIRDLCEAFPDKAVPALIAEAKSALVDSSSPASAVAAAGGGGNGEAAFAAAAAAAAGANQAVPGVVAAAATAASLSARRWRLREAALLCLGAASKFITRQVKQRCPLAVKLKKQQHCGGGGGARKDNTSHDNNGSGGHVGSSCSKALGKGAGGEGSGGGAGGGRVCKSGKPSSTSFSPGTLCRGARGLGLDLGGFQAVIIAAAEGRSHHAEEVSSPFVHARGLWATAKFASLLSAEGVCRSAEACSLAMGEGRPLCLRLHACRALRVLGQYSARIARKGGFFGIKRGAGKALLGSRVGAAARTAVTAAPGLASCCVEGTAHFAPETMTQLVKGFPSEAVAQGGDLVLLELSKSLWLRYPSDPLVVEAVEDLLLALTRVPEAVPRMPEILLPFFSEVFERVRAGEEELHAVAEGCLSLLRELIARMHTAPAQADIDRRHPRGGRGRTGGSRAALRRAAAAAAATRFDSSARQSLWAGLRAALPLLLETDSYSLVQDGCSTFQEFVSAFGSEIDRSGGQTRGALLSSFGNNEDRDDGLSQANLEYIQRRSDSSAAAALGDTATPTGSTISSAWARGAGGEASGEESLPNQHSPDTALSMVMSFLARVMAPGAHEASALRIGGLVSAVLTCVPPRSLGRETVQSLLCASFDKLERCSSSVLGDELLQVFVSFVNSEAYGPTALADAFAEIEQEGRRRRANGKSEAAMAGAEGSPSLTSQSTISPRSSSHDTTHERKDTGGFGLLLSASQASLSVDRGMAVDPAAGAAAAARTSWRAWATGAGNDDTMASLRRLIGLWLFFHEMVRCPSLAKRSALGLLRLLKAAGEGDGRLYTLRVSTDSMGSGTARGAGVRGRCLPPSLRKMEGELLPVCLLSSIVRTAARVDDVDSEQVADGRRGNKSDISRGEVGGCDDGDAIFSMDNDHCEDAHMTDECEHNGASDNDTDASDDSYDDASDEEDDDEEESDTEDVTREGGMMLLSSGGGAGDCRRSFYALDVNHRHVAAGSQTAPATPSSSASSSAVESMAQASTSLPASMLVDRGRLLSWSAIAPTLTTTASAGELSCLAGGSGGNLIRSSSSSSGFLSASMHARSASGHGNGGFTAGTTRVSSAPTAGRGGQLLSSSCPRDTRWLMMSVASGYNGDGIGSSSSLSTIHDRRRSQHRALPSSAGRLESTPQSSDPEEAAAAGDSRGSGSWEHVTKSWNESGVGRGLVRFLRSTTGTRSEALLCGWAGMLPAEEQAILMALLEKA